MKHFLSLLLALSTILAFGQTTKKALFFGNSYTNRNNMAETIKSIAQSRGNTFIYNNQRAIDAMQLGQHAQAQVTYDLINSDNWDFVIIQAQSQEGAYPSPRFENDIMPSGTQIANAAQIIGAIPIFFRTWGKKEGDSYFCTFAGYEHYCTYEGMDDALNRNYRLMAETNQSWLGPVGDVFRYLRTNNPEIELYNADKSHPSINGSYVAALTFYTLMFADNPELVTFNSTLNSDSNANAIKAAVKLVVYDNMAELTNVGPSDTIISVSAPATVSQSDVVSVQVNYSASQSRNIVVVFREKNAPDMVYGQTSIPVNAGSAFVDINVNIDAGTPLADNAYEFVAYVVPEGQVIDQSIDSGLVSDVSCVGVVIPTINQVTITSWPEVMMPGSTYDVIVEYSVTEARDIKLILQYIGADPITVAEVVYNKNEWPINLPGQTVSVGTGFLTFNIAVDSSYPTSIDLHHLVSWIAPVGSGAYTESIATPSKKFNIDIQPSLSLSSINQKNRLIIYPNPADDYLNIQLSEAGAIQILSLDGKLLLDAKVTSNDLITIDVSGLDTGLYVIKSVENKFDPVKFIKK